MSPNLGSASSWNLVVANLIKDQHFPERFDFKCSCSKSLGIMGSIRVYGPEPSTEHR